MVDDGHGRAGQVRYASFFPLPKRDAEERVMGVGVRPAEAGRRVRPIACRMEDQKYTRY